MKAMQINHAGRGPLLIANELPQPKPGEGELLIRVRAVGITPPELNWYPTTHTKDGGPRKGAVPGHEFSGVIAALGKNTKGFEVGQDIYGMSDWFVDGAIAEFCVTQPQSIAPRPMTLTHEAAATVPIGALTAWQGLFEPQRCSPASGYWCKAAQARSVCLQCNLLTSMVACDRHCLTKKSATGRCAWRR